MKILEKIYDNSPIFLQNVGISLVGLNNNRSRYGKEYFKYKDFLREFEKKNRKEQEEYCLKELKEFIKYASEKSPFYHNLYSNIDLTEIQSFESLNKLPIVTKEMLQENINKVYTASARECVESHTGGTTGKSLCVRLLPSDSMKRMAILDFFKERVGFINRKMRRATFNGKHIVPPKQKEKVFWRYNIACKQMIFSSFHITEENIPYYIQELNRFKPAAIDGFFTSMCDIANYMERHNLKPQFKPVAIFPTSETLTKNGRKLLERVFECKVYDQYASSECAPFVTECSKQHLHIELESGYIEKMDDSNEILVTSFTTHATPLIRYRIGDCMAFESPNKLCLCGLESPLVSNIQGRRLDFLYTKDGAKINSGNLANLFKNMPNCIIHAQLRQKHLNKIDMLLEIDQKTCPENYREMLQDEFEHKFGKGVDLNIQVVDSIPREKSGKFRFVINEVNESELQEMQQKRVTHTSVNAEL